MRTATCLSLVALMATLAAPPARADGVYITITGHTQGRIMGPAQYGGRLLGLSFNETTTASQSNLTGNATGRVWPSSYRVSFEWGSSVPQLQTAIVNGETLDIKFEFFTQSGGQDQVYYVATMTNALTKDLKLDFDASATPVATVEAEFVSNQVTTSTPAASTATAGSGGSTAAQGPGRLAHAPSLTVAQTRPLIRSLATDPAVNDAWMTVTASALSFHNEVAGPPAKTAELRQFEIEFQVPVDHSSGLPAGRRTHQPIRITKAMGSASADFQSALQHSSPLTQVKLEFGAKAGMHAAYTITLGNAQVTKDQQSMTGGMASEELQFHYTHITTDDVAAHKTSTDDWMTGN